MRFEIKRPGPCLRSLTCVGKGFEEPLFLGPAASEDRPLFPQLIELAAIRVITQ